MNIIDYDRKGLSRMQYAKRRIVTSRQQAELL